MYVQVLF